MEAVFKDIEEKGSEELALWREEEEFGRGSLSLVNNHLLSISEKNQFWKDLETE